MEDKTFELLTKMYSELTSRLDTMDGRLDTIDKKLDQKADKTDIVRLEAIIDDNSKALFDGYHQTFEKLCALETKVDELSFQSEKQDIEIRVIKGGK